MTRDLPDLEVYPPGALICAICGEEMRLSNWCATCYEQEMQRAEQLAAEHRRMLRRDLAEAKRRARTWKLGRVVEQ